MVRAINGITLKNVQHAEKIVRRAAANFAAGGHAKNTCITITTPEKDVYLSLQKLLQEETLCLPERDHTKLHLLTAVAQHAARQREQPGAPALSAGTRKRRRESRRLRTQRERRSISTAKLQSVLDLQASGSSPTAAAGFTTRVPDAETRETAPQSPDSGLARVITINRPPSTPPPSP